MTSNVGSLDRGLRVIAGIALIAAALGMYGPQYTSVWGWIGVIPLVTAFIGWCPAYSVFGISTCGRKVS